MLRSEKNKLKKYQEKRKTTPTTREGFTESSNDTEQDFSFSGDISRKRIGQLKSVAKHLIFTKETCSQHDVENEILDATPQEISVCLLVINTIKMFLPVKKNYNITAHQIHFCIFANDVLEYAGYSKFTRQLCSSTSIANIDALHLDAPSLYQIMNQKLDGHQDQADASTTGPIIYGYNNEPMPSIETARRNKGAVFNSVFDMTKIQETCKSYGLKFSQQIAILPGLKTVRILGVKKNTMPSTELKKLSYSESFK